MDYITITPADACLIIETRKPLGKFFVDVEDEFTHVYVGIDNSTGDAWTEEFTDKDECLDWLSQ